MDQMTGKELVLTAPTGLRRRRSKPELITVGEGKHARQISKDGRWHPDLVAEYLSDNARHRWLTVGELSRVFFTANTPIGKAKVRKRLSKIISMMLMRGILLITEAGVNGRVQAVKIYDPRAEQDKQAAHERVQRMFQRKELTALQFDRAMELMAVADAVQADNGTPAQ